MIKEPHNTVVTMPVADRAWDAPPATVRIEVNSQWDGLSIRIHEVLPNGKDGAQVWSIHFRAEDIVSGAHRSALADIRHLEELGKYASSEG